MTRIDSLRFEYTWQRHIRKGPTVAISEKLQRAVLADLRCAIKARKRSLKHKSNPMRRRDDRQLEMVA